MKKLVVLFSSLLIVISSFGYSPVNIDEQLLRSFATNFPNAQKVTWQELREAYVVSFIEDGIRIRIMYEKNGNLTHFLRYYPEEHLPLDIRLNIKKKYPDLKIFGIIEENIIWNLDNRSKTIYHIKLEDESNWFTVRAERNRKFKLVEILNKGN